MLPLLLTHTRSGVSRFMLKNVDPALTHMVGALVVEVGCVAAVVLRTAVVPAVKVVAAIQRMVVVVADMFPAEEEAISHQEVAVNPKPRSRS